MIVLNDLATRTTELVVRIRWCTRSEFEEVTQILGTEGIDLFLVIDNGLQAFLGKLTLKDFLLDGSRRQESVGEATLLLAIAPTSSSSL